MISRGCRHIAIIARSEQLSCRSGLLQVVEDQMSYADSDNYGADADKSKKGRISALLVLSACGLNVKRLVAIFPKLSET